MGWMAVSAWFKRWLEGNMSPEDKLDNATEHVVKSLELKKEHAGAKIALARTQARELDKKVREYETRHAAAILAQKQGKTNMVDLLAAEMTVLAQEIEAMTQQVGTLNKDAAEATADYQNDAEASKQLLAQQGQLKAAARMNAQLEKLRQEMKALGGGFSTAIGNYKAIANEIEVKTQTFRAMTELESGGAAKSAEVRKALRDLSAQETLAMIQQEASGVGQLPKPMPALENARKVLSEDPLYGQVPTRVPEDIPPQGEVIDGTVVEEEKGNV